MPDLGTMSTGCFSESYMWKQVSMGLNVDHSEMQCMNGHEWTVETRSYATKESQGTLTYYEGNSRNVNEECCVALESSVRIISLFNIHIPYCLS